MRSRSLTGTMLTVTAAMPEVLWAQGAFMIAYAALGLTLATWVFRKELDA